MEDLQITSKSTQILESSPKARNSPHADAKQTWACYRMDGKICGEHTLTTVSAIVEDK